MIMAMNSNNASSARCWLDVEKPWPELLGLLRGGPLATKNNAADDVEARVTALRRADVAKPVIFVGAGTCGLGAGARKTIDAAKAYLEAKGSEADVVEVGCVGLCAVEPILDVQLPGRCRVSFQNVTEDKVDGLLDAVFVGTPDSSMVLGQFRSDTAKAWHDVPFMDEHPFFCDQMRIVLANSGIVDPADIDEYIARGGYSSLAKALSEQTPDEVCKTVTDSGLRGRGGGGFSTGTKWGFARREESEQKYLICNADEGDPGAFMDRAVAESDPHRLLEGMAIAAYAIGASKAYVYIRAEYPLGIERLRVAIEQAKGYGLLGHDILGSGFSLEIVIKMGAGAFVCGEETALIHSIEGKRGMPRPRPPYPAVSGLFSKPTVINNVETLSNVPGILALGAEAFSSVGTEKSKGTKVFALSGMVERTGLVEVPMGTSIRDVVLKIGGGVPNGRACKAVQIGGPSGGCIPEAHFDIPTDYEALKEFGAIMGSGGLVVLDENTCMVDLAKFFMEFIQNESCGKCIPCREGTRSMLEILEALTRARRDEKDEDALRRFKGIMGLKSLAEVIKDTSLCGLGQTAPNPILSTLRWFRDEYEAHIFERRCPAGVCKELVGAPCETACPAGTEVWRYVAHIAQGEYSEAYRVIRQANPFPSICARVCHHPCETKCRCGSTGSEPIAVRALKRFVVDRVDPGTYRPFIKPAGANAKRVAVIGAGPSGLTAAHCLSAMGYKVTIFEKEAIAGGMLIGAIPEYRLPRDTLAAEVAELLNDNTEVRFGCALGKDITLEGLRADGYQAIYVALGAHVSRNLGLEGEDAKGILPGIDFLKAYNLEQKNLATGAVGIIGGGNSAVDAARAAIRQDGVTSVTIFYRRTENEMPAYQEEIEAALEEGVKIVPLVAPTKVLSDGGALTGIEFIQNELGERDDSGRQRPVAVPGSECEVKLDTLIVAISEKPDLNGLDELSTTSWGTVANNPESYTAGMAGVFAGGDVVRGPNTVIDAVADGKKAAAMIDRFLSGKSLKTIKRVKLPTVYIEPVETSDDDDDVARVAIPQLPVTARKKNFDEVDLCISEEAARCEAKRCLRCDLKFTEPK